MILPKDNSLRILFICAAIMGVMAIVLNGTAEAGDSPAHFLYAKWAFKYPENFLNHWAKPLYVMIFAPVAQLGFHAVKLMNVFCWTLQTYLVMRIARILGMKAIWWIPILSLTASMNLTHTLSALTEPLFAVWLAAGVFMMVSNRQTWGVLILSFLPFVRSEGLIILCPLLIYLMINRKWFLLPLLFVGHIAMAIIGAPFYGDLFWVFSKMSYAVWDSAYGNGTWYHFIINMPVFMGWMQSLLLLIGLVYGFVKLFLTGQWLRPSAKCDESWLVYGFFLAFFLAHSLYWYLGIFNSAGLLRVFVGVMPAILLIELRAIEVLSNSLKSWRIPFIRPKATGILFLLLLFISLFKHPFLRSELFPSAMQNAFGKIKAYMDNNDPGYKNQTIYVQNTSAIFQLGLDFFNRYRVRTYYPLLKDEPMPAGYVIYDQNTIPADVPFSIDTLFHNKHLKLVTTETGYATDQAPVTVQLFKVIDTVSEMNWRQDVLALATDSDRWTTKAGRRCIYLTNTKYETTPNFDISNIAAFPNADSLYAEMELYEEDNNSDGLFNGQLTVGARWYYEGLFWYGTELKGKHVSKGWNNILMGIGFPKKRYRDISYRIGLLNYNSDTLFISKFIIKASPK